jgi:branched-subunit amino acid aminotransferase/4-amino-4-deoxychorismate lyase
LEGITRDVVIELAQAKGIACHQQPLTVDTLYSADECFLTNTSMELMPVTQVDNHVIGSGRPGQMTIHLHDAFRQHVDQYLTNP